MSYFDDNEDRLTGLYVRRGGGWAPKHVTCNRCGAENLHWDDGVLIEGKNKVHHCTTHVAKKMLDQFEDLTK